MGASISSKEQPVVLITGCSEGGIGNCLARAFANQNCIVIATSRSLSSMRDLQGEDQDKFFLQELDVVNEESINKVVNFAIEKFGKIDILVNNAGIHCVGPLVEIPLSSIENTFNTNVYGPMRMVQAVVPHMIPRRKGKIVNVGSVAALAPGPWAGAYSATKCAIHSLSDTLRIELRVFGISVTTVVPGAVKSNFGNASETRYNRLPEWKFYKAFADAIRSRTTLSQGPKSTPGEELAKNTVAAVLKKNPPAWFSYGRLSFVSAILYHLPLCIRDFILRMAMKA
ncbi:hypothetical protein MKW98_026126 [Papaver atlanticum]|uniref:NADPH-dependent 1-acyldihydroxyacetone phosphate reductase n=1 Tax=Papaver atlanticum TaxID=357466 RepID=A0AAD4RZH6_9MAGN|nr:hypothetical protein MKW98_026126 [Papaver atlanticum]